MSDLQQLITSTFDPRYFSHNVIGISRLLPPTNAFGRVCMSVHPSIRLSVQAITFEAIHIGTSFLVILNLDDV